MVSADYIVGLTDGEGCFYVNLRPDATPRSKQSAVETHFYLKLRDDHLDLLKEVKEAFGCGAIYYQKERRQNHSPCYRFGINSQKDVQEVLIPFFEEHPLRGPKQVSFLLFKQIAKMVFTKEHLTSEGLEKIRRLKLTMNHRARPVREIRSPWWER